MRDVPFLLQASIHHFRSHAFEAAQPRRLPIGSFVKSLRNEPTPIPAITKWFCIGPQTHVYSLNRAYFAQYADFNVPLEVYQKPPKLSEEERQESPKDRFVRVDVPFTSFMDTLETYDSSYSLYIAQCSLNTLPKGLREDLPTPKLVEQAGRGDVYDSSIWIGKAPTYTPLHKDSNPNLFVQMAGEKVIRLFEPSVGLEIFREAQRRINTKSSESFRGEEMMQGRELAVLESLVWGGIESEIEDLVLKTVLSSGDGLFIPQGWWHSVKSINNGINGSVSMCADNFGNPNNTI